MKKAIFTISSMFLLAVFVACTHLNALQPGAKGLNPCQVKVAIVETVFAGSECVCFSPVFELYNPNSVGIHLEKFGYELNVGDFYFSGQQIPVSVNINPKGRATFSGAIAAEWASMSIWLMQIKGISMAEGMNQVIPLWKAWGAKLFNPKLREAWDKAKPQKTDFIFNGEYNVTFNGETTRFPYETSYSIP